MANKLATAIILIILIATFNIGFFVIKPKLTGKAIENNLLVPLASEISQEIGKTTPLTKEDNAETSTNKRKSSGSSSSGSFGGGGGGEGNGWGNNGGGGNHQNILSIESKSVSLNEEFDVSVVINSYEETYGLEFKINFNNSILNALNVYEGNFLKTNANTFPIITINNSLGRIDFANTRFGTQNGVSGSGEIAIIKFKAKARGTASLSLEEVKVVNNQLVGVIFSATNGTINIS